jgi:hypothetical protein
VTRRYPGVPFCLPGDVFFTRSSTLLGRLIRWAETDPGENAWANHTGVIVSAGWIAPPEPTSSFVPLLAGVVESLWRTEAWCWYEAHKNDTSNTIRIYRKHGITEQQQNAIIGRASEFVGRKYGWWKLGAHLIDRLVFSGRKTVSNFLQVDSRPICSYTAAKSFAAAGISFGMEPEAADPDEMMDHCESSGEWFLVGEHTIGGAK